MIAVTIAKVVIGTATSIGVGTIVGNLVKATTPANIGKITKTCVVVGGVVLGWVAGDHASKYVEISIDDVVEIGKGFMKKKTKESIGEEA